MADDSDRDIPSNDRLDDDRGSVSGDQSGNQDSTNVAERDTDDTIRAIGKSGVIVFLGTFLELGIAFFAKLIVARDLMPATYGELTVALTVLTVLGIIGRLGFDTGVPRNAPRHEGSEKRGVFVSALVLNLLVSVILGILLFVSAEFIASIFGNPQLASVLRVISLGVPAIPIMRVSISGTQAVGRSAPKLIVQNITHPLTRIAFVVAVVLAGASPTTVAGAYVASNWVGAIGALYFLVRYTSVLDSSINWTPMYGEMLTFSLPLMITTGFAFILGNTDTLMIQYFRGSADVGVYDISYMIAQMLIVAVGALSYLFLPNISELHADGQWDEIRHLFTLVSKWIVFITVPGYLLVVYFPRTFISTTFGAEYIDGAPYLVVLSTGYLILALSGPNRQTLSAIGDTKFIMYANGFGAALNISLNVTLIVVYGTIGAAFATAISLVSVHSLYNYKLYNDYDVTVFSWSLVKPVTVFVVVTGAIYVFVRTTVGRVSLPALAGLVVLAAGIYAVTILYFGGLDEEDVMLVRSAEQSLGVGLEPVKRIARQLM